MWVHTMKLNHVWGNHSYVYEFYLRLTWERFCRLEHDRVRLGLYLKAEIPSFYFSSIFLDIEIGDMNSLVFAIFLGLLATEIGKLVNMFINL